MKPFRPSLHPLLAAVTVFAGLPAMRANPTDPDLQALREQVQALEQQLKALAHQIEVREKAAATAAASAPKVNITDKGFTFASADNANSIKIRGLVQLDSRLFFYDGGGLAKNRFGPRRGRPLAEGRCG